MASAAEQVTVHGCNYPTLALFLAIRDLTPESVMNDTFSPGVGTSVGDCDLDVLGQIADVNPWISRKHIIAFLLTELLWP